MQDHEGIRGEFLDALADRFHDLEVDAQKVITAHAGLARHTPAVTMHTSAPLIGE